MNENVKKVGKNNCIEVRTLKGYDYGELQMIFDGTTVPAYNLYDIITYVIRCSEYDVFSEISDSITEFIDTWFTEDEIDNKVKTLKMIVHWFMDVMCAYHDEDGSDCIHKSLLIENTEIDAFIEMKMIRIIFKKIG